MAGLKKGVIPIKKKKRLPKIDCDPLSPVEIYQQILNGERKTFSYGFFAEVDGVEKAGTILRYLFETILQWTPDDIKRNYNSHLMAKYKLSAMFRKFNNQPFKALNAAYPGQFKEWELLKAPKNFWNPETAIHATKWLIEEKLKWTETDIRQKLRHKIFYDNGLGGMLDLVYKNNAWRAIYAAYPNQFQERDFKPSQKTWSQESAIRATRWLIEEKFQWTENDIKEKLDFHIFYENGLKGMLHRVYQGSPWRALNAAYPNRFRGWELPTAPRNYWNQETAIQATRWMIEEKLKWTDQEIIELLRARTFYDHGLSRLLYKIYHRDLFQAIDAAYPGRFQSSDFSRKKPKEIH